MAEARDQEGRQELIILVPRSKVIAKGRSEETKEERAALKRRA